MSRKPKIPKRSVLRLQAYKRGLQGICPGGYPERGSGKFQQKGRKQEDHSPRGCTFTSLSRSFRLPDSVRADQTEASYVKRVSRLEPPEKEDARKVPAKTIAIKQSCTFPYAPENRTPDPAFDAQFIRCRSFSGCNTIIRLFWMSMSFSCLKSLRVRMSDSVAVPTRLARLSRFICSTKMPSPSWYFS